MALRGGHHCPSRSNTVATGQPASVSGGHCTPQISQQALVQAGSGVSGLDPAPHRQLCCVLDWRRGTKSADRDWVIGVEMPRMAPKGWGT